MSKPFDFHRPFSAVVATSTLFLTIISVAKEWRPGWCVPRYGKPAALQIRLMPA